MFALKSLLNGLRVRKLALAVLLALGAPLAAHAQQTTACDASVKEEVIKALEGSEKLSKAEQVKLQDSLYEKFKQCGSADSAKLQPDDTFFVAARRCGAKVSRVGSIFFEEMPCCGYDPQRRTFACPVQVKQTSGFGGAPLPGSREYVLHCIADASGVLQPVGSDSVHLADSNNRPPWQFAVVANANENEFLVQPMNGQARKARSILSWNLPPQGCDYQPIWGNAIDYVVRLDQ
ncbi:hypothetical protein JRI60_29010 [Archangium violaceum]|uniref:hypothetical protein n=1 Tax=Archangium violaceum TaxID=83451 RepID=UPI0019525F9A|nr:hypothetical protein [Archangium violaceum]QRN93234.1 hypothetical protein JRI60_29010 [Archangium violaceum]